MIEIKAAESTPDLPPVCGCGCYPELYTMAQIWGIGHEFCACYCLEPIINYYTWFGEVEM